MIAPFALWYIAGPARDKRPEPPRYRPEGADANGMAWSGEMIAGWIVIGAGAAIALAVMGFAYLCSKANQEDRNEG